MQQTNDLNASQLAGSLCKDKRPAMASRRTGLATFLAGRSGYALNETDRLDICERFGLTNDELATEMAATRRVVLPIPAKAFGADALAYAMVLTGTNSPTPAQLDAALCEMYPNDGPTAASLVAAGWLVPTIDKTGLCFSPPHAAADWQHHPSPADVSPLSSQLNGNR